MFVLRNATRLPSFHHPVLSEFYHIIYIPGDPLPWHYKYEHAAVTTDCVIFTYEDWQLKVLLVRCGGEPYKGDWAFSGGR